MSNPEWTEYSSAAVKCRACPAKIVWMKSATTGKNVPVNADSIPPGTKSLIFDRTTMTAHFATCPAAGQFRKPKK